MKKYEKLSIELNGKYKSLDNLKKIQIEGNNSDRIVTCFCSEKIKRSLVPHLRKKHQNVWAEWIDIFIQLKNEGYNAKQTIEIFKANGRYLFSWGVIEQELLSQFEKKPELLVMKNNEIKDWAPKSFTLETTTVWSFRTRGSWAAHQNNYRGNWAPELVRNLLLTYTRKNSKVLDVFAGGGTTLIEAWLLGRKSAGIDISPISKNYCTTLISQMKDTSKKQNYKLNPDCEPLFLSGDSRNSDKLIEAINWKVGEIDLVCAHPPYLDALSYSKDIYGELSISKSIEEFSKGLGEIISSASCCLRKDGIFALLIGDVRKSGNLIPLGFITVELIKKTDLILEQIIIKTQHNDTSTNLYKSNGSVDYLIAHEYLLIARKPQ